MKAKKLLLLFLLSISMTGFCATKLITALSSTSFVFTPANITMEAGDDVHFQLSSMHDALEVSQSTWNTNGTTALSGGFHVPFGGDVEISSLSIGVHYYVCTNHASLGMKGVITVTALGVNDFQLVKNFSVFPNPAVDFVNISIIESSFGEPYRIMDQGGRFIYSGKLEDLTTAVDLSQFASGIYFLQVGTETRRTFKLIKK